jgi:NAD(P)-dependent dehydrogenase (short-subunit alcohol dehydrogenase family)
VSIRTYEGAVTFITGGASGIGAAIGAELKNRGAKVIFSDIAPGTHETLDVRDRTAVEACIARIMEREGRIDYVFNNAGTGVWGEAHRQDAADWDLVADVNFNGMLNVARAAYPRLVKQGFGHLVNTASIAGLACSPLLAVYSATKHAVVGLSKALRIEGERFGVRVSALCPGVIRTPILTGKNIYGISDDRIMWFWNRLMPIDVEPFAKMTADAVAKNEGVIVLPKRAKAFLAVVGTFGIEETIARKTLSDTIKQFPEMS